MVSERLSYSARWKARSTGEYTLHCGRSIDCRGFLRVTYDPEEGDGGDLLTDFRGS